MCQVLPCYGLLAEFLSLVSVGRKKARMSRAHLSCCLFNVLQIHPDAFDADFRTVESSFVHITGTSRGERHGLDFQKVRRKDVGCGEHHPSAAYVSEFTQALAGRWGGRIEMVESLPGLSGEQRRETS